MRRGPLITGVTLWGGFASTVCWPISAFLTDHLGWRGACLSYAAIHIAVVLPLYAFGVPQESQRRAATGKVAAGAQVDRQAFVLLAAGFTLASVIMTVISVELLALLQSRGVARAAAVGLGALVGPSQVGARVFEMLLGRRAHPIWSLLVSTLLVAVGLAMLIGAPGTMAVGIVLYGSGSGIRSIAREGEGLEGDQARPLAAGVAVGPRVEGLAAAVGAEKAGPLELLPDLGREGQVDTAGQRQRRFSRANRVAGQMDRRQRGGARRIDGQARPRKSKWYEIRCGARLDALPVKAWASPDPSRPTWSSP